MATEDDNGSGASWARKIILSAASGILVLLLVSAVRNVVELREATAKLQQDVVYMKADNAALASRLKSMEDFLSTVSMLPETRERFRAIEREIEDLKHERDKVK